MIKYNKKNKGIKIVEIVGNMELHYSQFSQVGNIKRSSIYEHIDKGETDFTCDGRHFKVISKQN